MCVRACVRACVWPFWKFERLVGNVAIHEFISGELPGRTDAYFWSSYLYYRILNEEELVKGISVPTGEIVNAGWSRVDFQRDAHKTV